MDFFSADGFLFRLFIVIIFGFNLFLFKYNMKTRLSAWVWLAMAVTSIEKAGIRRSSTRLCLYSAHSVALLYFVQRIDCVGN